VTGIERGTEDAYGPGYTLTARVEVASATHESLESRVLMAFDSLRRAMSRALSGEDGVPVGYDVLEIQPPSAGPRAVLVTATLLEDLGVRHAVEYQATLLEPPARAVVRAAGWTLVPGAGLLSTGILPTPPVSLSESPW
jgi:hypothetical protein